MENANIVVGDAADKEKREDGAILAFIADKAADSSIPYLKGGSITFNLGSIVMAVIGPS